MVCAFDATDPTMRTLGLSLAALWLGLAGSLAPVSGCDAGGAGRNSSFVTAGDACTQCKGILVECSSTAQNEGQFVDCRDQWQHCQKKRGVAADACANPNDAEACQMCRARLSECRAAGTEAAKCDQQFGVCKAFLMTRSGLADQCTEAFGPGSPELLCKICRDFATACASDASGKTTLALCDGKFQKCKQVNALEPASCGLPAGPEACSSCLEIHADCEAAGGTDCRPALDACAKMLAAGTSCEPAAQAGSGGAGGAGTGGAGGGPSACAHDPCKTGAAPADKCSDCIVEICAKDGFCCATEWDNYCVEAAVTTPICGCTI
jgi:hypothetical protein